MTIHMRRFARIAGWSPGELELFAELWPVLHTKEKSPAGTEDIVKQTHSIIHEAQSYENQNALRTQV